MIEVEIKARVENLTDLKNKLVALGGELVKSIEQTDIVFGHPSMLDENKMMADGGYSARIRQVDKNISLEFKEILRGKGGTEIRSSIASIGIGKDFLNKIGFEEAFNIYKLREIWKLEDLEISLDKVDLLGEFIEVEKMVNLAEEKEAAWKKCADLMEKLELTSRIELRQYGDLMQEIINKNK